MNEPVTGGYTPGHLRSVGPPMSGGPQRDIGRQEFRKMAGDSVVEWITWGGVALWTLMLFPAWYGLFFPRYLSRVEPIVGDDLPKVSILIPARDEAVAIEEALRRMLSLDYPQVELIAINDRSRDGTGEIMDRLAIEYGSRLQVVHVTELPAGWLGKNHAMAQGAAQARGEFLLFTDGDVMFAPQVLRRSMRLMRERSLDHLVLLPETLVTTFLESALINLFCILLMVASRFPLVRWKWFKDAYLGVGAFNLVRRSAFEAIGGFSHLQLEVADDVMLGRLIKHAGLNQDVYSGQGELKVRWQQGGVWSIIRGLEKNAFSGTGYSVLRTVGVVAVLLTLLVGPFGALACGVTTAPVLILTIGSLALSVGVAWTIGFHWVAGLFFPWAVVVFAFIMLRSMMLTLRQGGVRWRDTFYPLEELRRARTAQFNSLSRQA